MPSRQTAALGVAVMVMGTAWLATRPPTVTCGTAASGAASVHKIQASKIVVRPWLGPHHVYGVFVVPDRFIDRRYSATLAVDEFQIDLIRNLIRENTYQDATLARPGHYLEKAYVPTRVAFWFLLTGRFGDLRTPCRWQLALKNGAT